ncbi:hypothetical protein [Winogradskyella forsetii]|uniref:hypothetical protein n=1 Tax=Winogradskyella forsetii TaxID=2686077 RepID=UPI0015BAFB57|nr:hypothetical protein [Winogradskyella forsetii]
MKNVLIISFLTLCYTTDAKAQDLFFIGEKSYPCTELIVLQSNKEEGEDLNIVFAKKDNASYIAVTTKPTFKSEITDKLIIYLDDGVSITCNTIIDSEFVDDNAKAVYSLTKEHLDKMRKSNINTVRYTLNVLEVKKVNRSASNKGNSTKTNFPDLINEFFND